MANPVTDPAVLARFKAHQDELSTPGGATLALFDPTGQAGVVRRPGFNNADMTNQPAPAERKPVADPAVLARFKASQTAVTKKPGTVDKDQTLGDSIGTGFSKRGLGTFQSAYTVAKTLGLVDADPDLEAVIEERRQELEKKGEGTGTKGAVGEFIGDPIDWAMAGDVLNLGRAGIGAGVKAVIGKGSTTGAKIGGNALSEVARLRDFAESDALAQGAGNVAAKAAGRKAVTKYSAKKGLAAGAKYGILSGVTSPVEDSKMSTRLETIAKHEAASALLGGGLPIVGHAAGNLGRGFGTAATDIMAAGKSGQGRTPQQLEEALGALKDKGDDLFTQMRQNNVELTPQGGASMAQNGMDAFKGDRLDAGEHPVTTSVLRDLIDQVQNGVPDAVNPAKRTPFDVEAFNMLRQRLGAATGQDGAQAGKLRAAMFDSIQQPGALNGSPAALDNLNMALQQWQKASRFGDVAALANKANSDPNRIRSVVNSFTDKSKNTQGLLPDEEEALTRSGQRNLGEKIMGLMGGVGVNMGTIQRNPNVALPYAMAFAKTAGGAAIPGAGVPVALGTVANSVRNRIANGKLEKALRLIEDRPITTPNRPPAPPAAPAAPLALPAPTAPLALPAPPTIMVAPTGGAPAPATAAQRAEMYAAQQAPAPEMVAPQFGTPGAPSMAQQATTDTARQNMAQTGMSPNLYGVQRNNQVSAAEADKAIQDLATQQANANQLAASQPAPTIGDLLQQSQSAGADRAAATGDPAPELSSVGQALAKAIQDNPAAAPTAPAAAAPLKIEIHPHPSWWVPDDQLPKVNLPKVGPQ